MVVAQLERKCSRGGSRFQARRETGLPASARSRDRNYSLVVWGPRDIPATYLGLIDLSKKATNLLGHSGVVDCWVLRFVKKQMQTQKSTAGYLHINRHAAGARPRVTGIKATVSSGTVTEMWHSSSCKSFGWIHRRLLQHYRLVLCSPHL
ncbi:hypothetical protein N656DRAFT_128366 [Canariomyces notabilis]|uniref:Uncharacterized protein n=1 Tax=Canariomyces notabilis TaxID=2074819 RepID=A0AAN6TCU6_9PEZI|nr:hypothetical protein N656DRAFT_128366 [Canariomyces arenarius]